jgi:predicted HAD superfamily Cof-like phosphohydrolase
MIKNSKTWFETAVPNPTKKDLHTQLGVHLEEISEMFAALDVDYGENPFGKSRWATLGEAIELMGQDFKSGKCRILGINPDEMLDSLCDQHVTGIGVAHMLGMDIAQAVQEVDRSNWSKFDAHGNAIFNENRKIMKGPDYSKPNLAPYLPEMSRIFQAIE